MDAAAAGERPRPQYGEYATPEEQAARIRQPLPVPPPVAPPAPAPVEAKRARATGGRIVDRAVAIGLLVYGLLSMVSAIPATLNPAPMLEMLGLDAGELGVTSAGAWGVAAAIVLAGGWLLTAWATLTAHRRGWILFWIPLAGGFVFNAVSGVLVSIALFADPAVVDAILRQAGG